MHANFKQSLKHALIHEGGYVNHPNDPGGATNKGVTLDNFRRYVKPNGTVHDLKRLTEDQAGIVYKRFYWDKVMGDDLPAGVDFAVFDFGVNSGPSRAVKYLQAIVGATQDGRTGPATLAAVNRHDPKVLINTLCDRRLAYMKRIRKGQLWKHFGKGWSRRVASVRDVGLQMAGASKPVKKVPERINVDTPIVKPKDKAPTLFGWIGRLFS